MREVIRSFFIVALLGFASVASAQLPPEIMADKYLIQAEQLLDKKDQAGALKVMEKILALQKEHSLTLPDEFHFKYARVALSVDSTRIALESVNKYLSATGKEGEFYQEALALLIEVKRDEISAENTCTGKPAGSSCWMALANHPECYVWNSNLQKDVTATWTGECSNNKARGMGTLTWAVTDGDSLKITGTLTGHLQNGKPHGQWVERFADGDVFEGPYVDGKPHGQWVLRSADGDVFEGPVVDGKPHGQWVIRFLDGDVFEGPVVDSKKHGQWVKRDSDGGMDGNTNPAATPSQTQGGQGQDPMQQALQNIENVCGEKYRDNFADNDHYRFYCLAAFKDYCALKRAQSSEARSKLRASLQQNCAVLKNVDADSKCSYCK